MKKNILDNCRFLSKRHPCPAHTRPAQRKTLFFLSVCALALATAAVLTAPLPSHARTETSHHGVSVAVLPFEVFSVGKEPVLGDEAASIIAKQLALNPLIVLVDSRHVAALLEPDDYVTMNDARLRQMAKLLNANFIITGTVTKIRSEHSIDVEMFSTGPDVPTFKTFAEGLDVAGLADTLAAALDAEVLKNADKIPNSERPRVHAVRKASASSPAGGYDVDRELLAAFGPIPAVPQETTAPPASLSPDISSTQTTAAPALEETTLRDDMETAAALVSAAPPAASDTMITDRMDAEQKKKTDPGFFSLSKAISINADSMEYDNRANRALFKGNVVARQDDITMFANAMNVYYSETGGLSRVDARGNVRVVQGDRIATGENIVFNNATQTIVATGSPRVWQGDNVVHGRKITVYLKEERTVVEGDPDSRASATIHPESSRKKP